MGQVIKVVSGGQSGVDRAALDVALSLGLTCGGWCPKGRLAEDGRLADKYPLKETPTEEYAQRTEWNVRDSSGTLILMRGEVSGGTALTISWARRYKRNLLILYLEEKADFDSLESWIQEEKITVLNVAGPRESKCPGIYRQAFDFLSLALAQRL